MDFLAIRPISSWMKVDPIWLVVDHAPTILAAHVPQSMVEVRQGVTMLSVSIWQHLPLLLLPSSDVRVKEPMASQNRSHASHSKRSDEPVVVRRRIASPSMQPLLVEEIRDGWIGLILQEHRVSHAEGEGGKRPGL